MVLGYGSPGQLIQCLFESWGQSNACHIKELGKLSFYVEKELFFIMSFKKDFIYLFKDL